MPFHVIANIMYNVNHFKKIDNPERISILFAKFTKAVQNNHVN
jgi:hypothetical protein